MFVNMSMYISPALELGLFLVLLQIILFTWKSVNKSLLHLYRQTHFGLKVPS